MNVLTSSRLWALYSDLAESLNRPFHTIEAIYERVLSMKIVTPKTVLNYAELLEERGQLEPMFRVYERGLALFDWPHVLDIW